MQDFSIKIQTSKLKSLILNKFFNKNCDAYDVEITFRIFEIHLFEMFLTRRFTGSQERKVMYKWKRNRVYAIYIKTLNSYRKYDEKSFLFSSIFYVRRKHWIRENFLLLGCLKYVFTIFTKCLSIAHGANFVAAPVQELTDEIT